MVAATMKYDEICHVVRWGLPHVALYVAAEGAEGSRCLFALDWASSQTRLHMPREPWKKVASSFQILVGYIKKTDQVKGSRFLRSKKTLNLNLEHIP